MTLHQFNLLDFKEQQKTIWDKGTHLESIVYKEQRIVCYAVDKFFVDVIYDPDKNIISEIYSFKEGDRLDKYTFG